MKSRGNGRPRQRAERDPIGVGGDERRLAFARDVACETNANKALDCTPERVGDNGKGASGLERGT